MSNVSGQYNSVYNQNVLRNVFRPAYLFESGTFKSRLDSYLPGNVVIGDSNTQYSLLLNGNNIGGIDLRLWSVYPAISTVNLSGNNIVGCSNLYASNVIASNITTTVGNITVPQGNVILTSGNIVVLGNVDATRISATSSVVAENIGSATMYCVSSGNVFPLSLQPSYTSISFSFVIDPSFSALAQSITLAPRTLFEFVSTSSGTGILNVQLSNVSSIPLRITFPTPGTSRTPNFTSDSYLLRAI